jgi:hypothetical protein
MGTTAFLPKPSTSGGSNNGLLNFAYDAFDVISKTIDGPTVIRYYTGGLSGTLVATITITYDVDGDIDTVVRT